MNDPSLDFVIVFPAVAVGLPNAIVTSKTLLSTHSKVFQQFLSRKPDVDAFIVRSKVAKRDAEAIVLWMEDPTTLNSWEKNTLMKRYKLATKLNMDGLCEAIRKWRKVT